MPRVKKPTKVKEPVRLRTKKLADGSQSLYLDIYRFGKRTYEYLKLYLIPETDNNARRQNQATMNAANAIKQLGAREVYACATHPVLSGPAIQRIQDSEIKQMVLLNTIPIPPEKRIEKMKLLSVAPLFAETMMRVFNNESVSNLFD